MVHVKAKMMLIESRQAGIVGASPARVMRSPFVSPVLGSANSLRNWNKVAKFHMFRIRKVWSTLDIKVIDNPVIGFYNFVLHSSECF